MKFGERRLSWTPTIVSWLSFVIMGLVVVGIGLTGTAYVVGYLHERLTAHGVDHNREIAESLRPVLAALISRPEPVSHTDLQQAVAAYGMFGYRLFVLDRQQQRLVADSQGEGHLPADLNTSWLSDIAAIATTDYELQAGEGPALALAEDGHPMLIWIAGMQEVGTPDGRWFLGVASDQRNLTEFLGDLHWHLDGIMLMTYVLIAFLGYFAMRAVGRVYERNLEAEVRERTLDLKAAHQEVLTNTRLATIGQTASVLAHEMRNPLASIKLALSAMSRQEDVPERTGRRIDLVLGEVDRLDALLSETLDFVRPVKLSAQPIVLDQLISQVIQWQRPLLDGRSITLHREVCADCTAIRLDEHKMHQVLLNLLKNAIEASLEGGEIRLKLFQDENQSVVLEIANGGEVLGAEILERAFEPFYTTKPRGSGLGLGLVKRIVEEHGGSITLSSDPSLGTCVTVTLPIDVE